MLEYRSAKPSSPARPLSIHQFLKIYTVILVELQGRTSYQQSLHAQSFLLHGIIKTSPIRNTIEYIKSIGDRVLDEQSARIDQAEGVVKAAELGHRRIAVAVASFNSDSIEKIRKLEKERGLRVAVLSVCNTCAQEVDVSRILIAADVVCASASRLIRERVGPKALLQLGLTIPVFALTRLGKDLLLSYLTEFNGSIVAFRTRTMPYLVEDRGPK